MLLYGRARRRYWRIEPRSQKWPEVLALTLIFVVFVVVVLTGCFEIEKNECRAWGKQIRQNPGITQPADWQRRQCQSVGVPIEDISVRR